MRFERECHALGAVSGHPNIVAVHEGGFTEDGRAYLVMEYCPKGSLLDHLQSNGPLPAASVVDIGTKIGRALGVAHEAGVLHRDVKPANILVTAYGEPALADFGIARVEGGEQTATGFVAASFAHAAPEVLQGQLPTAASDLYSLGSTMYELLTGAAPHYRPEDESAWALMNRVISEAIPEPALAGIPEPPASTIRIAAAHRASDRFATADDFVRSLLDNEAANRPVEGAAPTRPAGPLPTLSDRSSDTAMVPGTERLPVFEGATVVEAPGGPPGSVSLGQRPEPGGFDGPAAGSPGATTTSRRRWPVVVSALVVVALAVGGAGFVLGWFGSPDPDPVVVDFAEGVTGPLDAGVGYELAVEGGSSSTTFQILVDGEPAASAAERPVVFVPEPGRYQVTVESTTGSVVEVSDVYDVYVIGEPPAAGYRVNLASVTESPENWAATIDRFDRLRQAGHDGLELLPSSRFASLTPGFWNLFVPGFGEDRPRAETYCEDFGLEIPTECFVSRFDPEA